MRTRKWNWSDTANGVVAGMYWATVALLLGVVLRTGMGIGI